MYIKPKRRGVILALYVAVLLLIMPACLIRIDTVCRQQVDTLNQLVELRMEVDKLEPGMKPNSFMLTEDSSMEVLSNVDYELICRVVAAEARGEGYTGMLPVAQVIKDRAQLWGMTPAEVVTAEGQFAKPYDGEIGLEVQLAVADVFYNDVDIFEEPVTHFHEAGVTPDWAENMKYIGQIGNHKFYRSE